MEDKFYEGPNSFAEYEAEIGRIVSSLAEMYMVDPGIEDKNIEDLIQFMYNWIKPELEDHVWLNDGSIEPMLKVLLYSENSHTASDKPTPLLAPNVHDCLQLFAWHAMYEDIAELIENKAEDLWEEFGGEE